MNTFFLLPPSVVLVTTRQTAQGFPRDGGSGQGYYYYYYKQSAVVGSSSIGVGAPKDQFCRLRTGLDPNLVLRKGTQLRLDKAYWEQSRL
jgi:hypothetical protein